MTVTLQPVERRVLSLEETAVELRLVGDLHAPAEEMTSAVRCVQHVAQRRGLRTVKVGRRSFVLLADLYGWLESEAAEGAS